MQRFHALFFVFILFFSCSGPRYYDRDIQDTHAPAGQNAIAQLAGQDYEKPGSPEQQSGKSFGADTPVRREGLAVGAGILAVASGAKNYYKKSSVSGTCSFQSGAAPNPTLDAPCMNFTLLLKDDASGAILRTKTSGTGAFHFNAKENLTYRLSLDPKTAQKYQINPEAKRPLKMGDDVTLSLQPIR